MSVGAGGFELNGCDAFMLAMDDAMRRQGTVGNICHLLVTLPHGTSLDSIHETMSELAPLRFLSRLRLERSCGGALRWGVSAAERPSPGVIWESRGVRDLEGDILKHRLNPRVDSPFGVRLVPHFERGPSLLFYWHHALCDARGGEHIVRLLAQRSADRLVIPTARINESLGRALRRAHVTKSMIFEKARRPIARFPSGQGVAARQRYLKISFTRGETASIDARARELTGGIFPMAMYLAATARSVAKIRPGALLIPVPHDMRRFLRDGSPLSNKVSFVFFRLEPHARETLAAITNEVVGQLHDLVAAEHHHGMLSFLRVVRRLPSRLLWRIIERPARGHPASIYFSDVGSSLSELTDFHGIPVTHASHYPPHLCPPGCTTVWSRYRDALEVTMCYDAGAISERDASCFESHLRRDLLGVESV